MGIDYVNESMPWRDWYPCLITALIAEEREAKQVYIAAGGEPAKWKAKFDVEPPEVLDQATLGKEVTSAVLQAFGAGAIKGNLEALVELGKAQAVELIRDEAGNYYDRDGNLIDFEKLGVAFIERQD